MSPKNKDTAGRQKLLALVMLALFIVSVLIAWGVSAARSAPTRRGIAIIKDMRDRGLSSIWQPQTMLDCYVKRNIAGNVVGYRIEARGVRGSAFTGGQISWKVARGAAQRINHQSVWRIAADMSAGEYKSHAPGSEIYSTDILMEKKTVKVTQQITTLRSRMMTRRSTLATVFPGNYIAEGTLLEVIKQVLASGKPAMLKLIYDDVAMQAGPKGSQIRFLNLLITPLDNKKVQTVLSADKQRVPTTYTIEAGKISQVTIGSITSQRVELAEMAQLMSTSPETIRARIGRLTNIPNLQPTLEDIDIDIDENTDSQDDPEIQVLAPHPPADPTT